MYRRTTLTRGRILAESRIVALNDIFCITCIKTLTFDICLVKSNLISLELLLYSLCILMSIDIWAQVAIFTHVCFS